MDTFSHWCHGELLGLFPIRSAKVQTKYDRFSTIFKGISIDNLGNWYP